MLVVDSSVWIEYLAGRSGPETEKLHEALASRDVAVPDLVLCEVTRGLKSDAQFRAVTELMTDLPILLCSGSALALASAQNFRTLRSKGYTVRSTVDCILATLCIQDAHTLLHRDRDYVPFELFLGLQVLHARLN